MRFVITVILAALLIVFVYIVIGVIVDGYLGGNIFPDRLEPDASPPDTWEEWRDVMIVLMGFWFALSFALLSVLLIALIFLVFTIRGLLRNNVAPAIDSLKEGLDNVRGTSEFVGETAVAPIVRVYSVVRGVRSGVGAVSGIGERIRSRRKK